MHPQERDAARLALGEGRLACDAANLAAETSRAGTKRKLSEPVSGVWHSSTNPIPRV